MKNIVEQNSGLLVVLRNTKSPSEFLLSCFTTQRLEFYALCHQLECVLLVYHLCIDTIGYT
jgi:hypothetical protein